MVIFPTQTDRIKLNIFCTSSQYFLSGIKNIDVLPMSTKQCTTGYLLNLTEYIFCASSVLGFGDGGIF